MKLKEIRLAFSGLRSVWTNPTLERRERLERTRELGWVFVASHLPKKLAYWSYMNMGVQHIHGGEIVPDVSYVTVLQRIPR
jgi:hypothetical protein